MTEDEEHARIVDQLRRRGWDKHDAINEADSLMSERIKRRLQKPAIH